MRIPSSFSRFGTLLSWPAWIRVALTILPIVFLLMMTGWSGA